LLAVGHNMRIQKGSSVISSSFDLSEQSSQILHGETDCLENFGRQPASVYARSTMYTTLSPCSMCTGAILLYKIPRVVIGENQNFLGSEDLLQQHGVEVIVLNNQRCIDMMKRFIEEEPSLWFEDIGVENV
jgi:cytosine/creatinine deaminase